MMTLQQLLKQKRRENGWYNREVAEKIGVHHSLISAYETGKRRPSVPVLKKLATLYGLPYLELLQMRGEDSDEHIYSMRKKLVAAEKQIEEYKDGLSLIRLLSSKEGNRQEVKDIATDLLFGKD